MMSDELELKLRELSRVGANLNPSLVSENVAELWKGSIAK